MHLRGVAACIALAIGLLGGGRTAAAQLVINEVDYDTPSTDNAEFIEIKNTSAGAVNLGTWSVRLIDPANNPSPPPTWTIDREITLPAVVLAAGDFFVICANANRTPNCDLDVSPDTALIENDEEAVELLDGGVRVDVVGYDGNGHGTPPDLQVGMFETAPVDNDTATPGITMSRIADAGDNSTDFDNRCGSPGADTMATSSSCSICGNGNTDNTPEQCDDGALTNGTTASCCTATCTFQPATTSCGSAALSECDDPDTCNATGVCQTNYVPVDTACGIGTDNDCTNPDKCDGNGTCLSNHEPVDTTCNDTTPTDCLDARCNGTGGCSQDQGFESLNSPCGNTGDSECDDPDTCDATGTCLENPEPATTSCGDSTDDECTDPDQCDGLGSCAANHEPDTTQCTDSSPTDCDDARCDGGGSCEQTQGFETSGTPCGSSADTECDNPDTCNAFGGCLGNHVASTTQCTDSSPTNCFDAQCDGSGACDQNQTFESLGTACGSSSDSDCDNPDTCNASGTCLINNENNGTGCGNSANTTCTDPDTCQAGVCAANHAIDNTICGDPIDNACTDPDRCQAGTCAPRHAISGTACGSAANDICTDPDTCDGSGACLTNNAANGTGCGDGDFCNGAETCASGVCLNPPDPCTGGEVCDEEDDTCVTAGCGDGAIVVGEECDDGNGDDDDGCSDCSVDVGWVCIEVDGTSECAETCGDGADDEGEECDDGNLEVADGCDDRCRVEDGWECAAGECTPACGDGVLFTEECDDGNGASGDGCSASCTIEDGFLCDDSEPTVCVPESEGCGGCRGAGDGSALLPLLLVALPWLRRRRARATAAGRMS